MPGSSGVQSWFPGGQRWTAPAHVMAGGARCPDENDTWLCLVPLESTVAAGKNNCSTL